MLNRIENWINEGSGWLVESINGEYVNISMYSPLIGSFFVGLSSELKNSKKGLINIKNNDNKCFLWCHVIHLNLLEIISERITKEDKEVISRLNYKRIEFPVSKKGYGKIEKQNNICIKVFCYEDKACYPLYVSSEKFSDCMDLLLTIEENKSHHVYIKDFDRFVCNKTKSKNGKWFCKCCLRCFSSERVLIGHKENCLVINGKQNVKLRIVSISFKNYSKQLPPPFKIYAGFECILGATKDVKISDGNNSSYTEKYQDQIPCSFAYKVVCVDNRFSKKVVLYRGKNAVNKFIESIFEEYEYCKKIIKRHSNKNFVISVDEEEKFQLANSCCIFDRLFDVGDEKVRDDCHVTGKYRGAAHFSCNANCKLSKKVPVIFHNLRGYDSHLKIKEMDKFDVRVSVIPNGLEKCMAFTVNKNLVFIDSMQFMNLSLDLLAKNLMDNDFKYLPEEFSGAFLKLVKEKGVYPHEYMGSFKKFSENRLPDRSKFFSSLKDECISEKYYQRTNNVWNAFKMKTLGDDHNLYLKTDVLLLADVFEKFIKTCLKLVLGPWSLF